jgi:hypothetical protein
LREKPASGHLFDSKSLEQTQTDAAPQPKYGIVKAVYLVAIGIATIGWLGLIAWIAMQLLVGL